MKLSLYLARRLADATSGPDWDRAESAYRQIEHLVEQLHQFHLPLRISPTEGDLGDWLAHRIQDWNRALASRSIRLEADGPQGPAPTRFDWPRLFQGIDGLINHWARFGPVGTSLRLSWGFDRNECRIRIEAGRWMAHPSSEAENLALPILARVLKAHRGSMRILDDDSTIELCWPTERPSPSLRETP